MKTCEFCGKEFSPDAKVCDGCGALRTKYITCEYCDSAVPAALKTCPHCGASLLRKPTPIQYENNYPISLILTFMLLGVILLGIFFIGIFVGFDSPVEAPLIDSPTAIVDTADGEFLVDLDNALDFFSFNQGKCSEIWLYHQQLTLLEQYRNAKFEDVNLKSIADSYISSLEMLTRSVNAIDPDPAQITITNRILWLEGYAQLNETLSQKIKRSDEYWATDYDYIHYSTCAECARLELTIHEDLQTQFADINLRDCGDGTCALDYINHTPADVILTFTTDYTVNGQIQSDTFTSEVLSPTDVLTIIFHTPLEQTVITEITWTIDSITINGQPPEDYYWHG